MTAAPAPEMTAYAGRVVGGARVIGASWEADQPTSTATAADGADDANTTTGDAAAARREASTR